MDNMYLFYVFFIYKNKIIFNNVCKYFDGLSKIYKISCQILAILRIAKKIISEYDVIQKGGEQMTDTRLLKSKMALAGYDNFTTELMVLVDCSWTSASNKLNGKAAFSQKEIAKLTTSLNLSGEEIKKIFANEV
jgi:hypothetical protein